MRLASILCLVMACLLLIRDHLENYWLGYSETTEALGAANGFIWMFVGFGLWIVLLSLAIASRFRKQRSWWPLGCFLAFWPLIILLGAILGPSANQVIRGLRDRVMHDYTLDDLRHFARDVNQAGFFKNKSIGVIHGDISGLSESEKASYAALKQKYGFMHWLDDGRVLTGPSILNFGDDDIVVFEWGGGFGHWGCSISNNGSRNDPYPATFPTIRVSDDIYFFCD
jgi:hypothetical protein